MGIGFYLQFGFAQHALEAAFLVAVSCGLIGPFVITRTMSFAVHGTSELAFTGAAEQARLISRVANLEKQKRVILLIDTDHLLEKHEITSLEETSGGARQRAAVRELSSAHA